jgi:hypothetical protein
LKSLIFEALGLEKLKPKVARLGSGLMFAGSFHHYLPRYVKTVPTETVVLCFGCLKTPCPCLPSQLSR